MTHRTHKLELRNHVYHEGVDAYCMGTPLSMCPYKKRVYARTWRKGWINTDREVTLAMNADQCDLFVSRMVTPDHIGLAHMGA